MSISSCAQISIKKVSGHKTDIAFQRYNLVTEEEMLGMKWLDLKKDEHRTMDTLYGHQGVIVKSHILYKPLIKLAHQTGLEPVTY